MKTIQHLLEKYLNFTPPALARSRAVCKALEERFGTTFTDDMISIRGDSAYVSTNGVIKSEIALHKKELLERVETFGGGALSNLS